MPQPWADPDDPPEITEAWVQQPTSTPAANWCAVGGPNGTPVRKQRGCDLCPGHCEKSANHDGRIDAQDPAYGAIQLWLDVNGDARSQGETQSLAQAGISAIVITADGMHIERVDGSTQGLGEQDLTGDTRGVIYSTHEDAAGLLQTTEQADGSGQTVLLAVNDDMWALAA